MSDLDAHSLHKLMRSWLLDEDPYGMNNRIEPTMGDAWRAPTSPPARPAPAGAESNPRPSSSPVVSLPPDTRAATAGPEGVANQLFGGQGARYSEAARDPRAQAWGEQAVERATGPDVSSEAFQGARSPVAQAQGESAVDRALSPPTGSGSGFWTPGEGGDMASAVGQSAVERALATKKKARSRLKDPVSETDKSPE